MRSVNSNEQKSTVAYLRTVAHSSSTFLFIPILSILFQTYHCVDGQSWIVERSVSCYSGGHIAVALLVAILLPSFVALCLFTIAVVFERNIRSTEYSAQVHGSSFYVHKML